MSDYKQFQIIYWSKNGAGVWYKDMLIARTFEQASKHAQGLIDAGIRVESIRAIW